MNTEQVRRNANILIDQSPKRENHAMAFVNEYISKEDFEKYRLHERDDAYLMGASRSKDWTIDRERNLILRHMEFCREERSGQSVYAFYWNGHWTSARIGVADCGGARNAPQWVRYKLHKLDIPAAIESVKDSYLKDLKEALTTYRGGGMSSTATEFTATFEF